MLSLSIINVTIVMYVTAGGTATPRTLPKPFHPETPNLYLPILLIFHLLLFAIPFPLTEDNRLTFQYRFQQTPTGSRDFAVIPCDTPTPDNRHFSKTARTRHIINT